MKKIIKSIKLRLNIKGDFLDLINIKHYLPHFLSPGIRFFICHLKGLNYL